MIVGDVLGISLGVFKIFETCKPNQQHVENSDYTLCMRLTPVGFLRCRDFGNVLKL